MDIHTFIGNIAGMPTNRLMRPTARAQALSDWLMRLNAAVGKRWPGATLMDLSERPWQDWFVLDDMTTQRAIQEIEMEQGPELDTRFPKK